MSVCLNCKHLAAEGASQGCPYPWVWCSKGHWSGGDPEAALNPDPWADCPDQESNPAPTTYIESLRTACDEAKAAVADLPEWCFVRPNEN